MGPWQQIAEEMIAGGHSTGLTVAVSGRHSGSAGQVGPASGPEPDPRNAEKRAPRSGQSGRGGTSAPGQDPSHGANREKGHHAGTDDADQTERWHWTCGGGSILAHLETGTAGGCRDALSALVGPTGLIKKLNPKARSAAPSPSLENVVLLWTSKKKEKKEKRHSATCTEIARAV